MAMPKTIPHTTPSAQVVGNVFVEKYYQILHQSPELMHRFYQDSSLLSRSDSNGAMTTVTTVQDIHEKITSLIYEDYTAEIKTADAQESHNGGVIVLVTGCLTGKDNVRRKFSQTFFLAPQEKGYYVLNDVFRYIEENDTPQSSSASVNVVKENAEAVHKPESEDVHTPKHVENTATLAEGEKLNYGAEIYHPQDEEEGSVIDEEVAEPPTDLSQNDSVTDHDSNSSVQDDAPMRSYASIVMKSNLASGHVYVPRRAARVASAKSSEQLPSTAKSTHVPEALAPSSDSAPGSSDVNEEAEGHSIYIRNLPFNATVEQLEEVFKKFGAIKHDGIQVRSSKRRFCFGFVEFEELSSMQSALEASPITVGERQAVVEEKRSTTRVSGSGRGRYPPGKGGFRSDSFRARGKFGRGWGYWRNEFRNQGEFSGQPSSYQWPNQNGGGRGGVRQGVRNYNSSPSA